MPHFRLTIAYDGTDFEGWQLQRTAAGRTAGRTVQGVLEEALCRLGGGERVAVSGAGRTDAGVHALGQVASFALARDWPPERLLRALNALLPEDVRVLEAAPCPPSFHARKSARSKIYRYVLDTGPVQLPTRRRRAGHLPSTLDEDAVHAAARLFLGRHDFASLRSAGSSAATTLRSVTRSEATFGGIEGLPGARAMVFVTEADGFLRKMVRSMVGGIVAAGRGAVTVEALGKARAARDRRRWPAPAEARGLTLVHVAYPPLLR
jgi:tRNA pseudouridine38-40 synthase